jgi:hypothetical protein
MRNYKYRIWRNETAQPLKDASYTHVPSKPISDELAEDKEERSSQCTCWSTAAVPLN